MANLFERLFGQANKKDEPYQPTPVTVPEYDSEYVTCDSEARSGKAYLKT